MPISGIEDGFMIFLGLLISVLLIVAAAVYSGTHKQKGNMGSVLLGGVILGTIIGGSCTIGTAQLAFLYGACAWWFCLGCAIAVVFLALFFAIPFRRGEGRTIMGIISQEYGERAGMMASVMSASGTFISILCQLIAATSVIAVIFPNVSMSWALLGSAAFMIIYVVFGGTRGAGLVGMVKLGLVYSSMILCGVLVLKMTGGFEGFVTMVNALETPNGEDFLNVFGRGVSREVGSCVAMIIGITTTQIYAQAICAARSDRVARWGTIGSALLIPIIGALGILVGLYMRAHYPDIVPKTALTQFVLLQIPDLLSGVILGTLFVTVVGSGAGLALGISTIINNDIVQVLGRKWVHAETRSRRIQILIVSVLMTGAFTCMMLETDVILNFAFLSMGLRGTVVFAPLCCALWLKNRIDARWALLAIVLGPFTEFILPVFVEMPFNPLFAGVGMTFLIMGVGLIRGRRSPFTRSM